MEMVVKMVNNELILRKIEDNEITAYDAYNKLYPVEKNKIGKRAFFVKINIKIPNEGKSLNAFLRILFAIPIPIIFVKIILRLYGRYSNGNDMDLKQFAKILKYSKNTKISVESSEALVDIKIM